MRPMSSHPQQQQRDTTEVDNDEESIAEDQDYYQEIVRDGAATGHEKSFSQRIMSTRP